MATTHPRCRLLPTLGLVVVSTTVAARAEDRPTSSRPIAVVELFTSQGCANCPPADAFLGELAREGDVVALSFAVDYWDYMGWKDTAARPEFTRRQRAYAARRGDKDVYTPQVVINGRTRLVGSDRAGIRREIARMAGEHGDLEVPVEVDATSDALTVRLPDQAAGSPIKSAAVWLARFDEVRTVSVGRGENTGRTLGYAHLVRSLQPIGMWKGHALQIELPAQEMATDPNLGCAVLVQNESDGVPGPIVGARTCSRPASWATHAASP